MPGGLARNLRQVSDAHNLACLGQRREFVAQNLRGQPSDAGVDLVEDQRGNIRVILSSAKNLATRFFTAFRMTQ